jgi:hypothetical protein
MQWPALEGENGMKTRFLAIAMALASVFAAQQAVAKSSKGTATSKKQKKHKKNKTGAGITVPTMKSGSAVS